MVKTTKRQKIGLITLGILIFLVLLEIGLRLSGFFLFSLRDVTTDVVHVDEYRILVLGESTSANLYNGHSSWPEELEKILNSKSTVKFKVINKAVPGTNTAFILGNLRKNLDKYNPDMVITMMGLNDRVLPFKYESRVEMKLEEIVKELRLYKLTNYILQAWQNKVDSVVIEKKKNKLSNYSQLGMTYLSKGVLDKAEKYFLESISKNNDDLSYTMLGFIYQEQTKLNESEQVLLKATRINPFNSLAFNYLGQVYYSQKKYVEAEAAITKAIELDPENERLYTDLGMIYFEQDKKDKAIDMFKKSIEINPNQDWSDSNNIWNIFRINGNITLDDEIVNYYKEFGLDITNWNYKNTEFHYQRLTEVLKNQNIKYIAVQYPTLDVNLLKNILKNHKEVIFINNENNFNQALIDTKYEDYFIDDFARHRPHQPSVFSGNYGHTTLKGNILIAENVAETIIRNLN